MIQYQVSFGDAVKRAFSAYCWFQGRASRSEYWWFVLFNLIVGVVISILGTITGSLFFKQLLPNIWSLAVLLPSLGLVWRRLHDAGVSGAFYLWSLIPGIVTGIIAVFAVGATITGSTPTFWWILLGIAALVTLVGSILVLVKLCQPSQPAPNKYGDVPNITEA